MIPAVLIPVICADATSLLARVLMSGVAIFVGAFLGTASAAFLLALRRSRSSSQR